jgi:hypothetical protein
MDFRKLCFVVMLGLGSLAPLPAAAIMSDDGMQLPWFRSKAEKAARQACEDDLPECRDSIRKQIASEKAITRYLPWILLCLVILGAVRYVNMREKQRDRRREEAARHHVRASLREEKEKANRTDDDEADDDSGDGFGLGTPGDRGRRG